MSTTRINPTVNGFCHLGHIYLALVNEFAAHSTGGRFIVRFDDCQGRWLKLLGAAKMAEYAAGWLDDLEWLGIQIDGVVFESAIHARIDARIQQVFPA